MFLFTLDTTLPIIGFSYRHCDISLVVVDIDVRLNLIVVRSLCGVVVVCTLEWAPIGWDRACADD